MGRGPGAPVPVCATVVPLARAGGLSVDRTTAGIAGGCRRSRALARALWS